MKFQAFHVNPGEKLKKKDVNNDLSNFMSVFPNRGHGSTVILPADDQAECHHFIIYDFDMDHIYMLKSDIIIYKEKRI